MGLIAGDDGGVTAIRGGPAIPGDASGLLQIGFPFGDAGSGTQVAIRDGIGGELDPNSLPLTLSEVQINGSEVGLQVGPKASVTLGPGRLLIGSPAAGAPLGGRGLLCQGTGVGPLVLGASVNDNLNGSGTDLPDSGVSLHSLEIIGQQTADIDVRDFCFLDLERAPVLGPEGDCASARGDPIGLRVTGASEVALGGGLVNCMGLYGAQFVGSAVGIQEDTLANTELLGAGCAGALNVGGAPSCSSTGRHFRATTWALRPWMVPGGSRQLGAAGGEVVCSQPRTRPGGARSAGWNRSPQPRAFRPDRFHRCQLSNMGGRHRSVDLRRRDPHELLLQWFPLPRDAVRGSSQSGHRGAAGGQHSNRRGNRHLRRTGRRLPAPP